MESSLLRMPFLGHQPTSINPKVIEWGAEASLTIADVANMALQNGLGLENDKTEVASTYITSDTPPLTFVPPCALWIKINPALADKQYHKPPEPAIVLDKLSTKKHALVAISAARKRPAKRPVSKITPPPTLKPEPEVPKPIDPPVKRKKKASPPKPTTPRQAETPSITPRFFDPSVIANLRVSLAARVRHLGLKGHDEKSLSSQATIRIICNAPEGSPEMSRAKRIKKDLSKIPGINARIPKDGAVASQLAVTHLVVPGLNVPSLFTTVALANGAWRVPYEWAEKTIQLSEQAKKLQLADETDLEFSDLAFRSKYHLFRGKYFENMLRDESKRDEIQVLLDMAGAIRAQEGDKPQIIVMDDDALPDQSQDPLYWVYSDFLCTFDTAALSRRAKEFRDWHR